MSAGAAATSVSLASASAAVNSKGCARWDPASQTALVVRAKGKYMPTMGFALDGQRLFPEEAVFLADSDEIDLVVHAGEEGDKALSKVRTMALLGLCSIDMKAYTVYAALREQRFHVYRHGAWQRSSGRAWRDLPSPRVVRAHSADGEELVNPMKRVRTLEQDNVGDGINQLFISFDVYRPQSGFSKNRMPKPDFSLIILSSEGSIPSVALLRATLKANDPSIPLRLAIVGDSSLTFIEVSDFDPKAEMASQSGVDDAKPAESTA